MGKVHGSLARAGKVKNQTPKVDKQPFKGKRKTGRSKKRFLYNKRYASLKKGTNPLRMKLNSIAMQQEIKEKKKARVEEIAQKKKEAGKKEK
ncbi:hypothetical protein C9374_010509 [Naegleria lovaniensis]|uniref:40S ribosomal protein S30 n=1 Tax=Naegleria lovaniensis TaxID=51637 RepID=A0AA88KDJ3_NAELO|nr:uncharacterized protein C9374_010509 [Naegleria lovaniensis]KAG2374765.1 hypothetical protein C9374_010509 [Naegleria lovaniensis]